MKRIEADIPLLYRKENWSEKVSGSLLKQQTALLKDLVEKNRKETVFAIAPLLDSRSRLTPYLRQAVAKLLDKFDALDYISLEARCRASSWSYHWNYQPAYVADFDEGWPYDSLMLYGVYSFHPSGYVREQALRALSQFDSSRALPFLLIRLNDWVPEIRNLAFSSLETLLKTDIHREMIECLPIMEHIRKCYRGDRNFLFSELDRYICERATDDKLEAAFNNRLQDVRRALIRLLPIEKSISSLMLRALGDSDPIVRTIAFEKLTANLSADSELLKALTRSKFPEQRQKAYVRVAEGTDEKAKEALMQGLMDRSSGVRSICQYFLIKNFKFDVVKFYEERLPEPSAIIGLSDINPQDYLDRFVRLAEESVDERTVCAALTALGKVDSESSVKVLRNAAKSDKAKVGIQALKQLARLQRLNGSTLTEVHESGSDLVRFVIIRITRSLSKWDSLATLLQLYIRENSLRHKELIAEILSKFLVQKKRVFTNPTKLQADVIRASLPQIDLLSTTAKAELLADLEAFE